jgi:hypothetical protein
MPEYVLRKLTTEYGGILKKVDDLKPIVKEGLFPLDAIYIAPSYSHQLTLMPDVRVQMDLGKGVDALYIIRLQKERLATAVEVQDMKRDYPVVDKKFLKGKEFKGTIVMHPLPRVDELAYEMDADPRSTYFKQAARGVPLRMALISLLLGAKEAIIPEDHSVHMITYQMYKRGFGVRCRNEGCVSTQESEQRYIKPEFKIVNFEPLTLRCIYCEREFHPQYIASSEWHEGSLDNRKYHSADSHWTRKIKLENLIVFDSETEAEAHGFKPSHYARVRHRGKGE